MRSIEAKQTEFDQSVGLVPPASSPACPYCRSTGSSTAPTDLDPLPRLRAAALVSTPLLDLGRQDQREHEAFNAKVLAAQPRRSWTDCGTQRFSIGALHARQLRAYLADAANRDERGRLLLHDERETALKGYSTYKATLAVEAGETYSEYLQARHTILLSSDVIARARNAISSLDILADNAQRKLPKLPERRRVRAAARPHPRPALVPRRVLQPPAQDTEEELARGKRKRDRCVVHTVTILLPSC